MAISIAKSTQIITLLALRGYPTCPKHSSYNGFLWFPIVSFGFLRHRFATRLMKYCSHDRKTMSRDLGEHNRNYEKVMRTTFLTSRWAPWAQLSVTRPKKLWETPEFFFSSMRNCSQENSGQGFAVATIITVLLFAIMRYHKCK